MSDYRRATHQHIKGRIAELAAEGLTSTQIAERLGISSSSARSLLSQARQAMKKEQP